MLLARMQPPRAHRQIAGHTHPQALWRVNELLPVDRKGIRIRCDAQLQNRAISRNRAKSRNRANRGLSSHDRIYDRLIR